MRLTLLALHTIAVFGQRGIPTNLEIPSTVPKHLVAFMGDSYSAGEGAPAPEPARWADPGCHRSANNGRVNAATTLDLAVPNRSVIGLFGQTTVDDFHSKDVSCSGATVSGGILGGYRGVREMRPSGPAPSHNVPSQISQIEDWMKASPRNRSNIDSLVIGIGGNDVGFATAVSNCMNPIEGNCNENMGLRSLMNTGGAGLVGFNNLREEFIRLDAQVRERLNPQRIILTSYPNGTRDEFGRLCDEHDEDFSIFTIDGNTFHPAFNSLFGATKHVNAAESGFLESSLLDRVNDLRRSIAAELGWEYIDVQEFTRTHGYCANEPWFNTPRTSWLRQADFNGAMHPNVSGYRVYEHFVLRALARAHDIRVLRAVSGNHERPAFVMVRRSDNRQTTLNYTNFLSGYHYAVSYEENFVARFKFLLNPNPSIFYEVRLEVSETDFAFNPSSVRVIAPAQSNPQEGMIHANVSTNQYDNNQLIFVRWRFKTLPFWNLTVEPATSYSTVQRFRF